MSWQWLENPARSARWGLMIRVALKALILFALVNVVYAALDPLDALGRVSIYNWLVPGLERISVNYRVAGNVDAVSATSNISALVAAHQVNTPKPADEFRVIMLGDSATRASRIRYTNAVHSVLNTTKLTTQRGQHIVSYNLAYPHPSLLKDFLLLEEALQQGAQPDAVIWAITLNSALPERQLTHPLVDDNLSVVYDWLEIATGESLPPAAADSPLWENTLMAQSRPLADLIRLQLYGFTWAAIQSDGGGNPRYTVRDEPIDLNVIPQSGLGQSADFFTFEIIDAARALLGDVPLIIINEPIYRVDDPNNALILNQYYRRDVYEHYQRVTQQYADEQGWHYVDLWDLIPPQHFIDSPLHYDAEGARILADRLADIIPQMLTEDAR